MAGPGSAQVAQPQVKWYEATFEAGGKTVRVEYLSDRELNNNQIADLVAKGNDYGKAFIDGRGQSSQRGIANAAELIRGAGEPTERGVAANASAADKQRFASSRSLESVGRVAGEAGEAFIEAGRRVASALVPVRTERAQSEQASLELGGRTRRARVVAETAAGESAALESAAVHVEVPQEAPKPEERVASGRQDTTTIPQSDLRGNAFEFRIAYDPSKLEPGYTEADLRSVKFFERPENRDAVLSFSYRNLSVRGDWNDELGGKLFHRMYSRLFEMVDFALVNPENREVQQLFTVYIDREKAEQLGIDTSDPQALIRSGVILRITQGAIGNERRWRPGSTEEVIAAWEEFIRSQRDSGYVMRSRTA